MRDPTQTRNTEAGAEARPKGILWLASYPRSGNTWTRAFAHNLFALLGGRDVEYDINAMHEFTTWDFNVDDYRRHMRETPSDKNRSAIAAARPKVQADIAARRDGIAIVKTHQALIVNRGYPAINLGITRGAIYIVRNPLDVAISYAHQAGIGIDETIALMASENFETPVSEHNVYEVYGSWSQNVGSWTDKPHHRMHVMRYEDMLADPAGTFADLARFLNLNPSPEQLNSAIERASFQRLQAQERARGFREKSDSAKEFFRAGRADQWRDELTPLQVRKIVQAHGEQMARFNYLPR